MLTLRLDEAGANTKPRIVPSRPFADLLEASVEKDAILLATSAFQTDEMPTPSPGLSCSLMSRVAKMPQPRTFLSQWVGRNRARSVLRGDISCEWTMRPAFVCAGQR